MNILNRPVFPKTNRRESGRQLGKKRFGGEKFAEKITAGVLRKTDVRGLAGEKEVEKKCVLKEAKGPLGAE